MEEKKRVKLSDKSPAPALDRGLAILELLAEAKEGLAFTQLQESLGGLNATTMTRLLRVLQQRQYIQKDSQTGRYKTTAKLSLFARSTTVNELLLSEAPGVMEELKEKFSVTALLIRFAAGKMVALAKVVHPDNVAMQAVGTVSDSFTTNPWGLMYLAHTQKLKSKYVHPKYADDEGELSPGMRRLSAPIYNNKQELVAALNVGSVDSLLTEKVLAELIPELVGAAEKLSAALGYSRS